MNHNSKTEKRFREKSSKNKGNEITTMPPLHHFTTSPLLLVTLWRNVSLLIIEEMITRRLDP